MIQKENVIDIKKYLFFLYLINPFHFENYEFDDSDFSVEIQKAIEMWLNMLKNDSKVS